MTLSYKVSTEDVHGHYVKLQFSFTAPWNNPILEMPVWTPGSYKIRDYSKNVERFSTTLNELEKQSWEKISKNQWKVYAKKDEKVNVEYYVYAYDLTVRTSYLDDRFGHLSTPSLFFYIIDENGKHTKNNQFSIDMNIPKDWHHFSQMKTKGGVYIAKDFDELVDSPIALAHKSVLETMEYEIDRGNDLGKAQCEVILIGYPGNQNINLFSDNLKKIQLESRKLFGELPYDRYLWILYVVGKGRGGLEHKYSNVSITKRWKFDKEIDKKKFTQLMALEAHEHFHAYNIKRIRPKQLGPFDYSKEVYTKKLWVAEGITSLYDNIQLPRSEIISQDMYWKLIAEDIKKLEEREGRKISSLELSSFDAWIKLYQPDENSRNSTISYYLKGSIVSILLDLEIRKQTNWQKSMDDFFRAMYNEYKQNPNEGYDEDQFQKLMEKYTDTDLENFFVNYIRGTKELPYNEYFNLIGMKLVRKDPETVYFGWNLNSSKTKVKSVNRDSPAMRGGIYANDRLLSINKFELKNNYSTIVKNLSAGEDVTVHLFRDGRLRKTTVSPTEAKPTKYEIIEIDDISEIQKQRREKFFKT